MSDESRKPVWLETWESSLTSIRYAPGEEARIPEELATADFKHQAERARLAAAAPTLVRALLQTEWAGVDGRDRDAACPICGAWLCTYARHKDGCVLDAALTAAGFPDLARRDDARRVLGVDTP